MDQQNNESLKTTSPETIVEQIRMLKDRSYRARSGSFYCEGVRFLCHARDQGAHIEGLLICKKLLRNGVGQTIARRLKRAGVPTAYVDEATFRELSILGEPQGVGLIVRQRWTALAKIQADQGLCWMALSKIRNAGNFGTMMRTCEAVGGAGIILVGDELDPFDPTAVRASMGAIFRLRFIRTRPAKLRPWLRKHHCLSVGTSPSADCDYTELGYSEKTVLFMGEERQGMTESEQALCSHMVRIPMVGNADSLNVAVATGLMLYEVYRARKLVRPGK